MQNSRTHEGQPHQTELTIEKALEFVGDNSDYQKKRLLWISVLILAFAVLNCKVTFMGTYYLILFLAASGLGQILCPNYLSLDICALALLVLSSLTIFLYPFNDIFVKICYIGLGFFGRGFFGCALIYLNEIGGERFRTWSLIVIFALWGISSLLASLEWIFDLPQWVWLYGLIFVPIVISSRALLFCWKPSPDLLFRKRLYGEAKEVLNDMAQQNKRPPLLYALEGEHNKDELHLDSTPYYFTICNDPSFEYLLVPITFLWMFREWVYFGSFVLIPGLSEEYSKNYILISISQTVAVLLSYPIRLKIRRVNTFFTLALLIAVASTLATLTTMPPECMPPGERCSTKFLHRAAIMITRFAIALTGNILISYTFQVYPVNLRNTAYQLFLTISGVSSIVSPILVVVPQISQSYLSGFLEIAVPSIVALFIIPKSPETGGRMNTDIYYDWEKRAPLIPLQNWKRITL